MKTVKVLFVCLGNICRSPTAHAVFETMVEKAGLSASIIVDSAGTSDWHIGKAPDARSTLAAAQHGYDLSTLRGRQAEKNDFAQFDYVLAMDKNNLAELRLLCPPNYQGHLGLFLAFSTEDQHKQYVEVPDPYYGGGEGFDLVLALVEDASRSLLSHIQKMHL